MPPQACTPLFSASEKSTARHHKTSGKIEAHSPPTPTFCPVGFCPTHLPTHRTLLLSSVPGGCRTCLKLVGLNKMSADRTPAPWGRSQETGRTQTLGRSFAPWGGLTGPTRNSGRTCLTKIEIRFTHILVHVPLFNALLFLSGEGKQLAGTKTKPGRYVSTLIGFPSFRRKPYLCAAVATRGRRGAG